MGHLTSGKSTPRELKIVLWNGDPNESDMGEAEEPVAGELLLTTVPSLLSLVKGVLALISRCSKSRGVDRTRLSCGMIEQVKLMCHFPETDSTTTLALWSILLR